MPSQNVTTFLNIDIDIRHRSELKELLDAIQPFVIVLHQTAQDASLELKNSSQALEEAVAALVELGASLPARVRKIWDECELRRANIGIQAGTEPHATSFILSKEAIALLSSARYEVAITVYAPIK